MMKCLNCDSSALFIYENPTVTPQPFCNAHLPSFMRPLAKAGLLATTAAYADTKASVLASLASTAADEAPVSSRKRRNGKRPASTVPAIEDTIPENSIDEDTTVDGSTTDGSTTDGTETVVAVADDEVTDTE